MSSHPNLQSNARVLVCVSGSIAAYKAADVVSALARDGHEVQCLVTESARQFVTETVLETLSKRPVLSALFGPGVSGTEHIRLARWASVIVFAPATANTLAKLAMGLCDDLATTVATASTAPLVIAPAMNSVMWESAAVQQNLETLRARGATIVEPDVGTLACGEEGAGKLASFEKIRDAALAAAHQTRAHASQQLGPDASTDATASSAEGPVDWTRERILMTAGPTRSSIDAVRYLTNGSTGKMGAAMAERALQLGARVDYILGVDRGVVRPQATFNSANRLQIIEVSTAEQMLEAALSRLPESTGVVASAAVLDYRVLESVAHKAKRGTGAVTLQLVPSVDVLASLRTYAAQLAPSSPPRWWMGFAAETDDIESLGREKLERKGLDWIFVNRVARADEALNTGFGTDTNAGILLSRSGVRKEFALQSKTSIAAKIFSELENAELSSARRS